MDADEIKIALRHARQMVLHLSIVVGADPVFHHRLVEREMADADDALSSLATAFGYRLQANTAHVATEGFDMGSAAA